MDKNNIYYYKEFSLTVTGPITTGAILDGETLDVGVLGIRTETQSLFKHNQSCSI